MNQKIETLKDKRGLFKNIPKFVRTLVVYGEGMVFHLTSHYYLQRSQGNKSSKASEVVSSLGIDLSDRRSLDKMSGEQFAAAYSSLRLLANILYERRRAYGV
jgi:hypothetical protein